MPTMLRDQITSHCFVNAPFFYLRDNINTFLDKGIQPEIGLEGDVLYELNEDAFREIALLLEENDLSCTLHAPFFELSVGALDKNIRKASRDKLKKAFGLIPLFKPASIVCHLGFEDNKHSYKQQEWFKYALEGWQELLDIATDYRTPMMLENTYELTPAQHKKMLQALDSPLARFCFDVGHVLAFAGNTWQDWLPELQPWLGQLHLHDNTGDRDLHLAVGQGLFPFTEFFDYLKKEHLSPLVTIEPHQENGVTDSLQMLDELGLFSE